MYNVLMLRERLKQKGLKIGVLNRRTITISSEFSKDTDVQTYFYDSRTEKSIFLVLTFKYYLRYKAQPEAEYLVSGLAMTKNRELFPT